jgi:hypothetical protein
MYCPECGHHNREAARFCGRCGASLLDPDAGEPTMSFEAVEEEGDADTSWGRGVLVIRTPAARAGGSSRSTQPDDDGRAPSRRVPRRYHRLARPRRC